MEPLRVAGQLVLIAGPAQEQQRYLQILARVTLGLKSESVRQAVLDAATPEEVVEVLVENGKPVEYGDRLFRIETT